MATNYDFDKLFIQLRRIEEHREEKAEKEIRKICKSLLKEMKQFVAEEYYNLAEDGKLTYEILRSVGRDARFLEEVEQRINGLSTSVAAEIRETVEELYQIAYDGVKNAVEKANDITELREGFKSGAEAEKIKAAVDNPIMDIALEKNYRNVIWDIKREIATGLTLGDRYETMARRISNSIDTNYKKSILISRTEATRVREKGHLDSAKDINEALEDSSATKRMVKRWKTMKDSRVRDHHVSMNNKLVAMEEMFELPDGVETEAPHLSGYARHDCNCRCFIKYELMDDAEFFNETGKHFEKSKKTVENPENEDIIDSEMYAKSDDAREGFTFISDERFNSLTINARKSGAVIVRGTDDIEKHLDSVNASAATIGNMLLFKKNVCVSEVLEETRHFTQNMSKMNFDKGEPLRTILNEIDAKQYIIDNAAKYKVPRNELDLIKKQLEGYEKQLAELNIGGN